MAKTFANVAASQTDSVILAAVSGKQIVVTGLFCMSGGTATDVTFNSKGSGAGVAISPVFRNGANGGAVLPVTDDEGWFETAAGEGLTVTTGAGSTSSFIVKYRLK